MIKKLISVWLALIMVMFSSISIYANETIEAVQDETIQEETVQTETVQGDFFEKHVIINGEEIINYNLQYPFILYADTTYFPLTSEMQEILGIRAEMDWESRTLKLLKTDSTRKNISSNWLKNNNVDLTLEVVSGAKVLAFLDETGANTALKENKTFADTIKSPKLTVKELELGDTPLLLAGKNLYVPLKLMKGADSFNWDLYFDAYYGICVSTNSKIPAKSYCNEAELLLNKGLVQYIKSKNAAVTTPTAQKYLFLFKRAGDVYNIDYKLLMAISSRESHFGVWATSRSGAAGMMQIMPSTGARFGLTKEQLYDAKTNIDFGAMYISERINAYNGDMIKGLSAYNQGSARVNRGTHSTVYADKVIAEYSRINNYLSMNGYVIPEKPEAIQTNIDSWK